MLDNTTAQDPWGNLAIFYKDQDYANGLIKLGRIDSGIETLSVPGSLKVTIDRAHGDRK